MNLMTAPVLVICMLMLLVNIVVYILMYQDGTKSTVPRITHENDKITSYQTSQLFVMAGHKHSGLKFHHLNCKNNISLTGRSNFALSFSNTSFLGQGHFASDHASATPDFSSVKAGLLEGVMSSRPTRYCRRPTHTPCRNQQHGDDSAKTGFHQLSSSGLLSALNYSTVAPIDALSAIEVVVTVSEDKREITV